MTFIDIIHKNKIDLFTGVTIAGSFDLSFPVFFKNKNDLKEYIKIAEKNKLFLRNMTFI